MEQEKQKPQKSPKKRVRKTLPQIKAALQELDSGEIDFHVWVNKHGINRCTVHGWRKQVERYKDKGYRRPIRLPKDVILKVVREVVSGKMSINEAVAQYDLGCRRTVQQWLEKYSCDIGSYEEQDMARKKNKGFTKEEHQQQELEKALKEAQLRILALETLIDVAEKELKIDIRKKPGTKQSK